MGRTNFKSGKKVKKIKPVKWHEGRNQQAYDFSLLGLTEEQMAPLMDVSPHTIQYWRNHKEGFKEALHRGRKEASVKVVNALFKSACGYSHPDTHFVNDKVKEYYPDGSVKREYTNVIQIPIIKHYPPNYNSINKFLSIKEREIWMENINIDINQTLKIEQKLDMTDMTDQELELMENIGLKSLVQNIPENNVSSN